ncbi:MAG: undecaprenyl-diphosphate phosphatase [Acidimicrobiales bacterium]
MSLRTPLPVRPPRPGHIRVDGAGPPPLRGLRTRWLVVTTTAVVGLLWTNPAAATAAEATADAVPGLSVTAAVVLGLVEGLTEYLPVSSTGHLLVATRMLGLGGTEASDAALNAYAICIQAGAILAVVVLYRRRLIEMVEGVFGASDEGRSILLAVLAAFVPTALIGLALKDVVESRLFGPGPVAVAWLVGGVAILGLVRVGVFDRDGAPLGDLTIRNAAIIGLAQAIALWPGVSRSLVTIVAGVLVGLSLSAAVEFSFLLGLLTLTAATALTALTDGALLVDTFGVVTPLIGLFVAFVSAVASVRWMVSWLQSRGFGVFGWYRIVIGVAALVAIAGGWL